MTKAEYDRIWRQKNRDKMRASVNAYYARRKAEDPFYGKRRGLQKYGMTLETYSAMVEQRENKCDICGQLADTPYSLKVDHCHKSGEVRGLLCHYCNLTLGHARDSIETLESCVAYLKHAEHKKRQLKK